ncbi:uncharacterized protein SETTUDRAFT_181741, partial [Exserohilum turcica Et28A]
ARPHVPCLAICGRCADPAYIDTKSKPYICPVCSKGFARIDLLKRHVANHDTEPANKRQKRGISRDTRVVQACEACSQSHL